MKHPASLAIALILLFPVFPTTAGEQFQRDDLAVASENSTEERLLLKVRRRDDQIIDKGTTDHEGGVVRDEHDDQ